MRENLPIPETERLHVAGRGHLLHEEVKTALTDICRRSKLDPHPSLCLKSNSKWLKDMKLPKENIGKTLQDTGRAKTL